MLRLLRSHDYRAAKRLFSEVFDVEEDAKFAVAWRERVKDASLGFYVTDVLVGASVVTNTPLVASDWPQEPHGFKCHTDGRTDGMLHLAYLFVAPEMQSIGIGGHLLESTFAECMTDRTCKGLWLLPAVDNEPLVLWYENNGFKFLPGCKAMVRRPGFAF